MLKGTQLITVAQMRGMGTAAIASGTVSGLNLITRAGRATAGQVRLRLSRVGHATLLCGPGANGGDGYIIANEQAQVGWTVRVLGADLRVGTDSSAARARWPDAIQPLSVDAVRTTPAYDVYIDALLGTGLSR